MHWVPQASGCVVACSRSEPSAAPWRWWRRSAPGPHRGRAGGPRRLGNPVALCRPRRLWSVPGGCSGSAGWACSPSRSSASCWPCAAREPSRRGGLVAAHRPGPASLSTSPSPSQSPASPSQRWTAPRRQPTLVAAVALVVASGIDGWSGHASTLPARSPVAALAASVHVLAAGVWAGALLVLVVTVLPVMRVDAATRRTVSPAAWRAFSPMAAISTVVLVATGLYESGRHVEFSGRPGAQRLRHGDRGQAAPRRGRPRPGGVQHGPRQPRDRRPGGARPAPGTGLASAPSPAVHHRHGRDSGPRRGGGRGGGHDVGAHGPRGPRRPSRDQPHSETVDGLFVTFEAVPVGTRLRLVVRTEAVVRPQPAPPTGVEVGVAEGTTSTLTTVDGHRTVLTQVEPGRWEGETTEPGAADWTAEVVVHRTQGPDAAILVPWSSASADTTTSVELVTSGVAANAAPGPACRRPRPTPPWHHTSAPADMGVTCQSRRQSLWGRPDTTRISREGQLAMTVDGDTGRSRS